MADSLIADGWSQYVVIRVRDMGRDEWTNVGIAVYDHAGNLAGTRFDSIDRAIWRGDWKREWRPAYEDYVRDFATLYATKDRVIRAHDSIGHAMSSIQLSDLRGGKSQGLLDDVYGHFVGTRPGATA